MTGRVIKVNVNPGDTVEEGDILLVIEAMKMENEIAAPMSGKIKEVAVAPGGRVSEGDLSRSSLLNRATARPHARVSIPQRERGRGRWTQSTR
jgi:predicted deacylase